MKKRKQKNKDAAHLFKVMGHASLSFVDIFDAFSNSRSSQGSRDAFRRTRKRHEDFDRYIEEEKQRQKLYNLIYRLEKQGLLKKENKKRKSLWFATKKGIEKSLIFKQTIFSNIYVKQKDKDWKIMIFDIPEVKNRYRAWLRSVLKNLDFEMLQKSVWRGKNKIPPKLIEDLEKFGILEYIKIFSIKKSGSIREEGD